MSPRLSRRNLLPKPSLPRCRPPRQGFTLIETMLVATLTSLLMGVAVALLHATAVWGQGIEKTSIHADNLHRLEFALRNEIRQATDVVAEGNKLTLSNAQGIQVEFLLDGFGCLQKFPGETRRERYPLGPRTAWQLTTEGPQVEIRLAPPEGQPGASLHLVASSLMVPRTATPFAKVKQGGQP